MNLSIPYEVVDQRDVLPQDRLHGAAIILSAPPGLIRLHCYSRRSTTFSLGVGDEELLTVDTDTGIVTVETEQGILHLVPIYDDHPILYEYFENLTASELFDIINMTPSP